jgi:predicted transposase/invertase (TIGR01784 family)
MSADERERRLAEEAEKRWRDARGAIAYAWDEGLAKGLLKGKAEGLSEGLAKGKAEIVRQMKSSGLDAATISKYTGISESEIDSIAFLRR